MWAWQQPAPGRIERIEHASPRQPAPGEVVVRYLVGGICGSDIPSFLGVTNVEFPHTGDVGAPLHEIVGEVVASASERLAVGDRVVGTAWPAGLAEYSVLSDAQLHALGPELDSAAAITAQPLATVLYALDRMTLPSTAAVLGLGPMGLLFANVLHARGVHVTGVDRVDRSAQAAAFGLDTVVVSETREWASALSHLADDAVERPELVLDVIGHDDAVLADAVEGVRSFGQLFSFGLPEETYAFPMRRFFRKTLTLRAGATFEWPVYLAAAERYLLDHPGLAAAYVTHELPVERAEEAFRLYAVPARDRLKVILTAPSA
jgi:threonine dehydrogenase-like Zn-dependent dehydrogenase